MSEHHVDALLERAATSIEPGVPAVGNLLAQGRRSRWRRALDAAVWGVAGATMVVAGVGCSGQRFQERPDVMAPVSDLQDVPAGSRLLGQGQVAIVVPEAWAHGSPECAQSSGGIFDFGEEPVQLCRKAFPSDLVAVNISAAPESGRPEGSKVDVPGGHGVRQPTTCDTDPLDTDTTVCTGALVVGDVIITVQSSRSPEEVDALLSTARVTDLVGVPSPYETQYQGAGKVAQFLADLRALGFTTEEVDSHIDANPASVHRVHPAPGTMLPAGSSVTVEVSR